MLGDNITKKIIHYYKNLRKPPWKGVAYLTRADLSKILHKNLDDLKSKPDVSKCFSWRPQTFEDLTFLCTCQSR